MLDKLYKGYSPLIGWCFGYPLIVDSDAFIFGFLDGKLIKHPVDPASMRRGSGYRDLYEGDIVINSDGEYGFLEYSTLEFCWFVIYPERENRHQPHHPFRRTLDQCTTRNIRLVADTFLNENFNYKTGN